jgi:predicted PurR-regulated permease PerM
VATLFLPGELPQDERGGLGVLRYFQDETSSMMADYHLGTRNGDFAGRVWTATLIVTAVLGAIALVWLATGVFLLFFAAILFAIFLRAVADLFGRFVHLSRDWSLASAIFLLLGLCAGTGWLLAGPISRQADQLSTELPQAVQKLENQIRQYSWGDRVVNKLHHPDGLMMQTGDLTKKVQSFFSVSVEGMVDILVILFCAFYFAARPNFYVNGFLRLVPCQRRDRARIVLGEIGTGLRHWIFGQIVSMSIIGVLSWVGLLLLGIPASVVLGVLAGVLDFVPVAGPWVAGIISCVLALSKSPMQAVYVACLFTALHLLEGHLIIPLVQRRATKIPPALTILAMVLFYKLFGFLGLLLAVPLLAVTLIAVRALYVENVIER